MTSSFVWFDNAGESRPATTDFPKDAFGWVADDLGPMTFLSAQRQDMPFSATSDVMDGVSGWVPYVEVDEVPAAVAKACKHGAEVVAENLTGPAGVAGFIRDPGGSPIALWKRAVGNA